MEPDQEPSKKKAGRPSKIAPEILEKVVKLLGKGAPRCDAAILSGITYQTFLNWYQSGEKAKSGELFEFFVAVQKAEAENIQKLTEVVYKEAEKNPKMAFAILTRRSPAWREKLRIEDLTSEQIIHLLDNS